MQPVLQGRDDVYRTGRRHGWTDQFPKITQDGKDGDEEIGYIANMRDSATAGFKYFDCKGVKKVKIKVRGYCNGAFEVKTSWDGPALGTIPVDFHEYMEGIYGGYRDSGRRPGSVLYVYRRGNASLASFTLI